MKKPLAVLGGLLIALAPVIVLAATMYTLMLPNIYRSSVRISVAEDAPAINPFTKGGTVAPYNPYFLRTQFEVIQSKPILYEVANRLNLQEQWGRNGDRLPREVACKILRNSVQVSQMRDTSLIVISVSRDNPDEAAEIANEIAVTYRDARMDMALNDARGAIDKIEEALKEQQLRVEQAEDNLEQEAKALNVEIEDAEAIRNKLGSSYRPVRTALAEFETEQFIFDELTKKHRREFISLEVPRNPVEIIDVAEPNRRPVSPNLFMNVFLSVALAGMCAVAGGIMMAIGLRKPPPPIG